MESLPIQIWKWALSHGLFNNIAVRGVLYWIEHTHTLYVFHIGATMLLSVSQPPLLHPIGSYAVNCENLLFALDCKNLLFVFDTKSLLVALVKCKLALSSVH